MVKKALVGLTDHFLCFDFPCNGGVARVCPLTYNLVVGVPFYHYRKLGGIQKYDPFRLNAHPSVHVFMCFYIPY